MFNSCGENALIISFILGFLACWIFFHIDAKLSEKQNSDD